MFTCKARLRAAHVVVGVFCFIQEIKLLNGTFLLKTQFCCVSGSTEVSASLIPAACCASCQLYGKNQIKQTGAQVTE